MRNYRKLARYSIEEILSMPAEKRITACVESAASVDKENCLDNLVDYMNGVYGSRFKHNRPGRLVAYKYAQRLYSKYKITEILEKKTETHFDKRLKDMPHVIINFEDRSYYLHPIIHGTSRSWIGDKQLQFIDEKCISYALNGRLFYEQGLQYIIPILRIDGENFEDHSMMSKTDCAKLYIAALFVIPLMPILNRCSKVIKAFKDFASDLRYSYQTVDLTDATMLPEPIKIAYNSERGGIFQRLENDRSELMAKKMVYSNRREVHAIFGVGHLQQIIYFIQNIEKMKNPYKTEPVVRWVDGY